MKTSDFDYCLPPELIAQTPIEPRDQSRLMVIDRRDGSVRHQRFFEMIDMLRAGDVLVMNDTRVIPARLSGRKVDGDGRVEVLLVRRLKPNVWETLVKPGRRVGPSTKVNITGATVLNGMVSAEVVEVGEGGIRVMSFSDETRLFEVGKIPLPPYIHAPLEDPERYQTVYASQTGSIAAPTAGLHFTNDLVDRIRQKGVSCQFVTLHIELDTFRPVREEDPSKHVIHREYGVLTQAVAGEINLAKAEGRRVICVGTTAVRLVEAAARAEGQVAPFAGWIDLFILPGYRFKIVDTLLTNFHLPRSTLLMLVSAFAGRELVLRAYQEAIAQRYRFYSFGDAMLIL